jgi:hypothetical protein
MVELKAISSGAEVIEYAEHLPVLRCERRDRNPALRRRRKERLLIPFMNRMAVMDVAAGINDGIFL